jgi:hypothetical protein
MTDTFDHAGLKALSKELGRPLFTLEVLRNDPFTAGVPARKAGAEWFAKLWKRLNIRPGAHLHRIHYVIVSQEKPVLMPNGKPYENTQYCESILERASLDARYLDLVKPTDLVDRRNEEPIIHADMTANSRGFIGAWDGMLHFERPTLEIPISSLGLSPPNIPQRYHLEIWIEKTTMDDVLDPLARRYGINLVRGAGEMSLTRCIQFIERAEASGRLIRILYVSDFDPAGASMPVAVARKIEFVLYRRQLHDLNIQVRPIALTHDQCVRYRLPRTPLKETERRSATFEARFGEGATELDALEALRPGELERILTQEIERYYDNNLPRRRRGVEAEVWTELRAADTRVHRRHAKAIKALEVERKKALAAIAALEKKARPILYKIKHDLQAEAPDVNAFDWPEPEDGDDDLDPLFDSTREYVEQIDRYKLHQGKPISVPKKSYSRSPATCTVCGKAFEATSRNKTLTCSASCLKTLAWRTSRPDKIACSICGELFQSIRDAKVCPNNDCRNAARRRKRESEQGSARRGRS